MNSGHRDREEDGEDVTKIMTRALRVSLVLVLLPMRRESQRLVSECGGDSDSGGE